MFDKRTTSHDNETWQLVPLPPSQLVVGYQWVFIVKYRPDGSVECSKAHLVAKGYTQAYGVDYAKRFSLVAKIVSVWIIISLIANLGWP